MAEDHIRYDILAQDALRGVVRKVLQEVSRTGLPGDHHFFIGFATHAPGVRISSRLLAQYPEDMTIVIQHQFWDLNVSETAFEVRLSFDGVTERLHIPFTAIKSFLDPSVQFGLQFQIASAETPAALEDDEEIVGESDGDADNAEATKGDDEPAPLPVAVTEAEAETEAETADEDTDEESTPREAEVVSLDAFRKKN